MELPRPIREYLAASTVEGRSPAYLMAGKDGRLLDWDGETELYGIECLHKGERIADRVPLLQGLLPLGNSPVFLECVRTESGLVTDVHLFEGTDGDWILLLDATKKEILHRVAQQKRNEQNLVLEQSSGLAGASSGQDISEVLALGLGIIVLEQLTEGSFRVLGTMPEWCKWFGLDGAVEADSPKPFSVFPALETFLQSALSFWIARETGRLRSAPWIATDSSGSSHHFEALAICLNSRRILLIELLDPDQKERSALLETAGEQGLRLETTMREVKKAEAILRALISDQQDLGS